MAVAENRRLNITNGVLGGVKGMQLYPTAAP